jgi:hypothetical protein
MVFDSGPLEELKCFPILNNFEICALRDIFFDTAKLSIKHVPSDQKQNFNCVHATTTISPIEFNQIDDPIIQEKILETMEMVEDDYSIPCDIRMFGAISYAQGLSELFKEADPVDVFQTLIDSDLMTIGTSYPLNSEIAKFIARNEKKYKNQYIDYLRKTLIDKNGKPLCQQIFSSIDKFYERGYEIFREKSNILEKIGCFPSLEKFRKNQKIVENLGYEEFDIVYGSEYNELHTSQLEGGGEISFHLVVYHPVTFKPVDTNKVNLHVSSLHEVHVDTFDHLDEIFESYNELIERSQCEIGGVDENIYEDYNGISINCAINEEIPIKIIEDPHKIRQYISEAKKIVKNDVLNIKENIRNFSAL